MICFWCWRAKVGHAGETVFWDSPLPERHNSSSVDVFGLFFRIFVLNFERLGFLD
jgi:hypothetical protein